MTRDVCNRTRPGMPSILPVAISWRGPSWSEFDDWFPQSPSTAGEPHHLIGCKSRETVGTHLDKFSKRTRHGHCGMTREGRFIPSLSASRPARAVLCIRRQGFFLAFFLLALQRHLSYSNASPHPRNISSSILRYDVRHGLTFGIFFHRFLRRHSNFPTNRTSQAGQSTLTVTRKCHHHAIKIAGQRHRHKLEHVLGLVKEQLELVR